MSELFVMRLIKYLTLLVGDIVRNRETVDVSERHSNVFGLSTRETSSEVGVAEETGCKSDEVLAKR
jgi:hypothetical protein